MERSGNFYKAIRLGYILISILIGCMAYNSLYEWQEIEALELGNKKIDELRKEINNTPRLCSQAWKWSLGFTSMTSFLRWSMQTKLYGKSRNGVSFDRLACNRQKETLFLMPYYWDMKGWRATVSCRLDCAIKMGLRVVAIKVSRCQHGKQRKVLGSIVLKYFKAYRQGFFLPCHSRRKLVWGTRTVFLRRRLTFIQNTRKDENMQTK